MNPAPGKPTLSWDVFAGLHLQAATPAKREAIRCHLLGLRLLQGDDITDPQAAYRATLAWQQPVTSYTPPPAQPQTRSLEALLARGLDSDSPGITDAEAEILYRYEHEEYIKHRRQRNGHSSCRLW